MWVALITRSRIISNQQYVPCSLYQTCLVHDSGQEDSRRINYFKGQLVYLPGIQNSKNGRTQVGC